MMRRALLAALIALTWGACDEAPEPGVMLAISAPDDIEDDVETLRVIVRSGPSEDEYEERADEVVRVKGWPAEVFLRPTDFKRAWEAEVWARNERGQNVAVGIVDGWFMPGPPLRLRFVLLAIRDEEEGARALGGERDASAVERDAATPSPDAGSAGRGRDASQDARGVSIDVDAHAQPLESGARKDAAAHDDSARFADAASPAQQDAGVREQCAAASAYPITSACGKCTCMKCATQVTSCAASAEAAKNTQCLAVRGCAEKNTCMGQECYCGSSLLCTNPDGPCVSEMQNAAGGSDLTAVQNASMDQASPLGRSVAVGECQAQYCRSECGL